jgi:hypothetical protein
MRAQGVDKGEEDENHSSNEDLEEVPLDDLDVSDSDEGSGGYDSGEENDPTLLMSLMMDIMTNLRYGTWERYLVLPRSPNVYCL